MKKIYSTKAETNLLSVVNFNKRIENYKETEHYLRKLNKYNCLVSVKKGNNYYEYHIDDGKIVLINRIGSNSKYGIIYLTSNKFNKNFFATKLTNMDNSNYKELLIAIRLSKIAVRQLSPHFLLVYKSFFCINNKIDKNIPDLIKNENYYISINELINGNFKQFLDYKLGDEYISNAFQQILIAILSFHYFTNGIYHNDCHYKNFLFIKIKSGGYFHYKLFGKDYYVKNMGYLWLIWDFGLALDYDYYKLQRIKDYFRITYFFDTDIAKKILTYKDNYEIYFGNSDKKFFDECVFKNKLLLTKYDISSKSFKIVNKKPYIINDF
jgi:hypothetical protein